MSRRRQLEHEVSVAQERIKKAAKDTPKNILKLWEQINVLLQKKMSKKDIAKAINVDLSTIYRELKRNSGSRNHYNWETDRKSVV